MSKYIYLLKSNIENVYKFGMNKNVNGAIILFQMICADSKILETCIIDMLKEHFKERNDIGSNCFEGDYTKMIEIMYSTLQNMEDEPEVYEITTYEEWICNNNISDIIITNKKKAKGFLRYKGDEKWRVLHDKTGSKFDETTMEHLLGFIEHKQHGCFKMIPGNKFISSSETVEYNDIIDEKTLKKKYKFLPVVYNVDKIFKDVIKKCYFK